MNRAGSGARHRASVALFHGLEAADHGLDPGTYLLVLLQERRPFRRQGVLALLERAVLVLQLVADFDQCIQALFQSPEFAVERCGCVVSHGGNIEPDRRIINRGQAPFAWQLRAFRGIMHAPGRAPALDCPHNARIPPMEQPIDYDQLNDALRRAGSTWEAAPVHGLLCSRLAAEGAAAGPGWLAQVLEGVDANNAPGKEAALLLDALYGESYRQLAERQSDFTLLLPDDETAADERARALAHWCEGFLHGLVSGQRNDAVRDRLAREPLADMIKDLLQITRATAEDEESDEVTEEAWVELVEYVRVAAQLAYEELAELRNAAEDGDGSDGPSAGDALH